MAAVKKHVLILGAGFAGLELAAQLSESLQDEVRVTLLDQGDSFSSSPRSASATAGASVDS